MSLVYFVREKPTFETLHRFGLEHICELPDKLRVRQILNHPEGFSWAMGSEETISEQSIGYYPGRQRFQAFEKFGIAFDGSIKFDPNCLLRKNYIRGHEWESWDGSKWIVPVARRWEENEGTLFPKCALDQFLTVDSNGEWVFGGVLPKHQKLWKFACDFWDSIVDSMEQSEGESYRVVVPDPSEISDIVFGANYRVSRYEMGFLRAFTPQDIYSIAKLVLDDPGLAALQKKTV